MSNHPKVTKGRFLLQRKELEPSDSLIITLDQSHQTYSGNEFEILEVGGSEGHPVLKPGNTVYIRNGANNTAHFLDKEMLVGIFNLEDILGFITLNGYFAPIGQTVFLARDNQSTISDGGVIIPDEAIERTQSKTGWVEAISPEVQHTTLKHMDRVIIEWSKDIHEVGQGGSSDDYFLVVPIKHVLATVGEFERIEMEAP
jgi:co-chaperonin GroES (HSP10)